jgi:hypothetical protein
MAASSTETVRVEAARRSGLAPLVALPLLLDEDDARP